MKPLHAVAIVGLGLASVLAVGAARNAQLASAAPDNAAPEDAGADDSAGTPADILSPWAHIQGYTMSNASQEQNIAAGLAAIRYSEGTARAPDPYRVCYSYRHTIQDFSDHPAATGEWHGESLDNLGPAYAGKISTAAGAYQLILPTWRRAKAALSLPDFSPASQDAAAAWLIDKRHALDDLRAGNLQAWADKCAPEWASLPASTAGQGTRSYDQIAQAFTDAGGAIT